MVSLKTLDSGWFILQDPIAPGEHLVMESMEVKLTPLWLSPEEAQTFAHRSPAAQGMLVQKLDTPTLKESYLLALGMLGVERVVLGYQPGIPNTQSMGLKQALKQALNSKISR